MNCVDSRRRGGGEVRLTRLLRLKNVAGTSLILSLRRCGGGGIVATPPLSGKDGSKSKYIFVILIFLVFPFVITILKYLRHKVDLVRCFTLTFRSNNL